jgi:hypothetical protein
MRSNAQYWRDRAAEALLQAAQMRDVWSRWQLIQIAVGYEHLATRAERDADPNPATVKASPLTNISQ